MLCGAKAVSPQIRKHTLFIGGWPIENINHGHYISFILHYRAELLFACGNGIFGHSKSRRSDNSFHPSPSSQQTSIKSEGRFLKYSLTVSKCFSYKKICSALCSRGIS